MSGDRLRAATSALVPEFDRADWSDMWEKPLSTGKALEWALTAALVHELGGEGWHTAFPLFDIPNGPSLFRLRNELPVHHGRQPGTAAAHTYKISLSERFLQALLPKVVFHRDGRSFSLFREGCPYHVLLFDATYSDRPDILLVEGAPTPPFPRITAEEDRVQFAYQWGDFRTSGIVRVANAPRPILIDREPVEGALVPCIGMIESTVGKAPATAHKQLSRYEELFLPDAPGARLPILVATTRPLVLDERWPVALVDLKGSTDQLITRLRSVAEAALNMFSLR